MNSNPAPQDVVTTLSDTITSAPGEVDVSSAIADLDTAISGTVTSVQSLTPDAEGVLSTAYAFRAVRSLNFLTSTSVSQMRSLR